MLTVWGTSGRCAPAATRRRPRKTDRGRAGCGESRTLGSEGGVGRRAASRRVRPLPYHSLPLVITCAETDQFIMLSLRPGNVHAALGADGDLAYLVTRLRQVWPDVALHVRGDCGFGVPAMYDVCE